jgi:hypothetical protein
LILAFIMSQISEYERVILEHYQLSTPNPEAWPAEKDLSDGSDEEGDSPSKSALNKLTIRRSRSRYSALERAASDRRSLVPGSQKTGDGLENLVQRDEPDPLGSTESVVRVLRQLGLPIADDTKLRWYPSLISGFANNFQATDSSFPRPPFLLPCFSPRFMRTRRMQSL